VRRDDADKRQHLHSLGLRVLVIRNDAVEAGLAKLRERVV